MLEILQRVLVSSQKNLRKSNQKQDKGFYVRSYGVRLASSFSSCILCYIHSRAAHFGSVVCCMRCVGLVCWPVVRAGVAQPVEHLICNQRVGGSNPFASSSSLPSSCSRRNRAQVAEWLMAADCKSATQRVTEVRILPCAPFPELPVSGDAG